MVAVTLRGAVLLLLAMPITVSAQQAASQEPSGVLVDRIVALVDETPIFESDIVAAEALGLGSGDQDLNQQGQDRRRLLDQLIDERLRYAAVRRHGSEELDLDEVDLQVEAFVERFGGVDKLAQVLDDAGMNHRLLREMVARQLAVWDFVDNRLGARVLVDLDDIESYYEGEFKSEMENVQSPLPPLREVRESIRELLYQRQLTEEVERWTEELRFEADISDYLERDLSSTLE